jgi:hypothetical protein
MIKAIVDQREDDEALVQRLPRDEKDRRVTIYNNYLSYFDNETALNTYEMDELCTWVTGYSGTVRVLHTTDESRTYSGKRPIGINGINIPISNSDVMNRTFVVKMEVIEDGSDGISESKIIPDSEFIKNIRRSSPEIMGYIFDIIVKALQKYDEVRKEIKPNHRLADFVIWGETISRVLGNKPNDFLKAWQLNTQTQKLMVLQNNAICGLIISYVFNARSEIEFEIEPEELFKAVRGHAYSKGIEYDHDKYLPRNSVWLTRIINTISNDLKVAGLTINTDIQKEHRRFIGFKKNTAAYQEQSKKLENSQGEQPSKKKMALERFRQMLQDNTLKIKDGKTKQEDFQANLVSSGKFYQDTALFIIEDLIKDGLLAKEGLDLRLNG